MRSLLVIALCLTGCATSSDPLPKQPDAPTNPDIVASVGKDWDKIDGRVAAAVKVARENKDKPAVVEAETGVALSYLPNPSEGDVAFARQRAAKADQKDYAEAVAYGKKLLAKIDADWAQVEASQKRAFEISQLKDARIAELTAEVERVKAEASKNIWTMAGVGCALLGALSMVWAGPKVGIPLLLSGAAIGAFPVIADSEWFSLTVITAIGLALCLGLWYLWDKVRDANNQNDEPPPPKV